MDPKFQSSFIPKKPLSESSRALGPVSKNTNIFSVIATILFLIPMFVCGGLFVYEKIVQSQIVGASKELDAARTAFEEDKIHELIDAGSRLNSIRGMLNKHLAVSELIFLLQNFTVKTIQFSNFTFTNKNGAKISMDGESVSYNAVAKQSELFASSGFLFNSTFSDFALAQNGLVKFKYIGSVSPKLISYKESLTALEPQE